MNRSIAFSQIISSHREIMLGLFDSRVLELLHKAQAIPEKKDAVKVRYAGTLLLNHCMSMFYYLESGVIDREHWDSFIADAADMFALPAIRQRWTEVENFYPRTFRAFVNDSLLKREAVLSNEQSSTPPMV